MRATVIICAALAGFLVAGCGITQEKTPVTGSNALTPVAAKLPDIPVPYGFKLLTKNSYSFESGAIRVAVLRYKGSSQIESVVRFYKEQMPLSGWTLLNIIQYENSLLNFERDEETCIVDVSPRLTGVLVTVSLGPKPSMLPKTPQSKDAQKKKSNP
jgi:hypothetical protein